MLILVIFIVLILVVTIIGASMLDPNMLVDFILS